MAYLRGEHYLWTDGEDRLHVWVHDGGDYWEESGWACDLSGERKKGRQKASGVSIPEKVMDEYVMMRLAQLMEMNAVSETIDRALRHGNFGGAALTARAEAIKAALKGL